MKIIYFKIIAALVLPFLILIITLMIKYLRRKKQEQFIVNAQKLDLIHSTRQRNFRIRFSMLIKQLAIILFLYSMDNILYQSFQLFACINIGDEKNQQRRILNDLTVSCEAASTKKWQYILCTPILVIFGIVFPLGLIFILIYNYKKKTIDHTAIKFQFGFMYYAFDKKFFFWELIIIFRKILISIITIIFAQEIKFLNNYPSILICFVITVATILQLLIQPYNQKDFQKLNQFENLSLITQLISVLLFIFQLYTIDDISEAVRFINLWILVFINMFFGFFFISLFYQHKLLPKFKRIQEQALQIKNKLFNISPGKQKHKGQSYYFSRSQKSKQNTIQEEDVQSYKPVSKLIEEGLRSEIKQLKAIIKLKNEEIALLKQRLDKNQPVINESIYLENKIIASDSSSENGSQQIEEDFQNIDISENESQRIIAESYLKNEITLVQDNHFIIRKQNFQKGEYSSTGTMSCGSQNLVFISNNIQLVILDVQLQLPKEELESHDISATVSKAKRKVFPELEQITYEFQIFYEFLSFKEDDNFELLFYPYIKIILADFCAFQKKNVKKREQLQNEEELQNDEELENEEQIDYDNDISQELIEFISQELINSSKNLQSKQIFGEFDLNIPNIIKSPLRFSFEITLKQLELSSIKINEKTNKHFISQFYLDKIKTWFTNIFEITVMALIQEYKEKIS